MEYVSAQDITLPALGFGTARMDDYETQRRAIDVAIETGYRHLDTAQSYGSEQAVGDAVRESGIDRAEFWLTTKLAGGNRDYDRVLSSTEASLERLGTDYLDLLLIHHPNDTVPHEETLRAMNELHDDGLVRQLGVSNFSIDQCNAAIEASPAPILTNQVKYHARHRQDALLTWCLAHDVLLTAYSPLAIGDLLSDSTLQAMGESYGKTVAQVAIRWLVEQPHVLTIPMSSSPSHIRENFDVFDFELSSADRRVIYDLEGGIDDELAATLDV